MYGGSGLGHLRWALTSELVMQIAADTGGDISPATGIDRSAVLGAVGAASK